MILVPRNSGREDKEDTRRKEESLGSKQSNFSFKNFFQFSISPKKSVVDENGGDESRILTCSNLERIESDEPRKGNLESQFEFDACEEGSKARVLRKNLGANEVCSLQNFADLDDILSDLFLDEAGLDFQTSKFTPDYYSGCLETDELECWRRELISRGVPPVLSRVQQVVLKPKQLAKLPAWSELCSWIFDSFRINLSKRSYCRCFSEYLLQQLWPCTKEDRTDFLSQGLRCIEPTREVSDALKALNSLFSTYDERQRSTLERLVDSYCQLYHPLAQFEVRATSIYSGNPEACIVATDFIEKGNIVRQLIGQNVLVPEDDLDRLYRRFSVMNTLTSKQETGKCFVLMGPARFVNHNCSPNVGFRALVGNAIGFEALRDIAPGHEIVVSYGDSYWKAGECRCLLCQSKGRINDKLPKSKRLQELQMSYTPVHTICGPSTKDPLHCNCCGVPTASVDQKRCSRCERHYRVFKLDWPNRAVSRPSQQNTHQEAMRVKETVKAVMPKVQSIIKKTLSVAQKEETIVVPDTAVTLLRRLVKSLDSKVSSDSKSHLQSPPNEAELGALTKACDGVNPATLVYHSDRLSQWPPSLEFNEKFLFCRYNDCGKGFASIKGVKTHLEASHRDMPSALRDAVLRFLKCACFSCQGCGSKFSSAESYVKHCRFMHPHSKTGQVTPALKFKTKRKFVSLDDEIQHLEGILAGYHALDRSACRLVEEARKEAYIYTKTRHTAGSKVQVLWSDKYNPEPDWYDAIILKVEWEDPILQDVLVFKVRYLGYSSSYDEWVYEHVLRKAPKKGGTKGTREADASVMQTTQPPMKRVKIEVKPESEPAMTSRTGQHFSQSLPSISDHPRLLYAVHLTNTLDPKVTQFFIDNRTTLVAKLEAFKQFFGFSNSAAHSLNSIPTVYKSRGALEAPANRTVSSCKDLGISTGGRQEVALKRNSEDACALTRALPPSVAANAERPSSTLESDVRLLLDPEEDSALSDCGETPQAASVCIGGNSALELSI